MDFFHNDCKIWKISEKGSNVIKLLTNHTLGPWSGHLVLLLRQPAPLVIFWMNIVANFPEKGASTQSISDASLCPDGGDGGPVAHRPAEERGGGEEHQPEAYGPRRVLRLPQGQVQVQGQGILPAPCSDYLGKRSHVFALYFFEKFWEQITLVIYVLIVVVSVCLLCHLPHHPHPASCILGILFRPASALEQIIRGHL